MLLFFCLSFIQRQANSSQISSWYTTRGRTVWKKPATRNHGYKPLRQWSWWVTFPSFPLCSLSLSLVPCVPLAFWFSNPFCLFSFSFTSSFSPFCRSHALSTYRTQHQSRTGWATASNRLFLLKPTEWRTSCYVKYYTAHSCAVFNRHQQSGKFYFDMNFKKIVEKKRSLHHAALSSLILSLLVSHARPPLTKFSRSFSGSQNNSKLPGVYDGAKHRWSTYV